MISSQNRVEVSLSALRHNYSLLKNKTGNRPMLAMVKADAYGHGMVECAQALAEEGVECFGVAEAVEGVLLRKAGIQQPVLIMTGILPEIIPALFQHNLTPVIVDAACLDNLSAEALRRDQAIDVHLKVDAGMGRQGCSFADFPKIVEQIKTLPGINLVGIMAHFPCADDQNSSSTSKITSLFCAQLEKIGDHLPEDCMVHLANSGAVLYFPGAHQDMIRPGIALYGCYPDGQQGRGDCSELQLSPVMRFSSRVIQVKDVPAGTGLGYGHSFITKRPTRIALIPVGYEDGYLRCLSNKAQGLIQGKRVSVVGRISMNITMFDVTDIDNVCPGDEVVLLGRQGMSEITADEIACWMQTINYEVCCLFGNLNQRLYVPG